jgi:hypothetical protein
MGLLARVLHRPGGGWRVALAGLGLAALLLVIALSWRIVAQRRAVPPAAPSAPKPQVTEVIGRVVTPDGKPVAGATVALVEHQESEAVERASTTTDATGAFRFPRAEWRGDEPPPLVAAVVPGWGVAYHAASYWGKPISVTLPPPSTLQIAFEDAAGRPLRGLSVAVERVLIHGAGGQLFLPPAWQAKWARKTDARGGVSFSALPQGGQVRMITEDERFAQLGRWLHRPGEGGGHHHRTDHRAGRGDHQWEDFVRPDRQARRRRPRPRE